MSYLVNGWKRGSKRFGGESRSRSEGPVDVLEDTGRGTHRSTAWMVW